MQKRAWKHRFNEKTLHVVTHNDVIAARIDEFSIYRQVLSHCEITQQCRGQGLSCDSFLENETRLEGHMQTREACMVGKKRAARSSISRSEPSASLPSSFRSIGMGSKQQLRWKTLRCIVVDKTGVGVPDLVVGAYLCGNTDPLWQTTTDQEGQCKIELPFTKRSPLRRTACQLHLVVANENGMVPVEPPFRWAIANVPSRITIELADPEQASIAGMVTTIDDVPLAGLRVRIMVRDFSETKILGEDVTDDTGGFDIRYPRSGGPLDLLVEVQPPDEQADTGPIREWRFNSGPFEHVDIVFPNLVGPNEFELVGDFVHRIAGDRKIAEIKVSEQSHILSRAENDRVPVRAYLTAAKLAQESGLKHEIMYALIRDDFAQDLERILERTREHLRAALEQARANNVITSISPDESNQAVEVLKSIQIERVVSGKTTSVGGLLDSAGIEHAQKRAFLGRYLEGERGEALWQKLKEEDEFGEETVEVIRRSFELGSFTDNHIPLLNALIKRQDYIEHGIRVFARLNFDDWIQILNEQHGDQKVGVPVDIQGDNDEAKKQQYARLLVRRFEEAYPSVAVSAEMERRDSVRHHHLVEFLKSNPAFDFERTSIRAVLPNPIGNDERDRLMSLKRDLESCQRVFRIAPKNNRYSVMRTLLDAGYDSASKISKRGIAFIEEFANALEPDFGQEAIVIATNVYRQSRYQAAIASEAVTSTLVALHQPQLNVIPSPTILTEAPPLEPDPDSPDAHIRDWRSLFGSIDYCSCEEWRSVLSPAAYLVDLLEWLKGLRLYDVFGDHRPDIETIALSRENTDVPIPRIDLINELLEEDLAKGRITADAPHNTTNQQPEALLAYPEHLLAAAYQTLREEAVYPLDLPFDLWAEQARAYLKHLGVERWELIEAFPTASIYLEHEVLGISAYEAVRLSQKIQREKLWGYKTKRIDGRVWNEYLSTVSTFLKRANLTYDEMLDLLDTDYANPSRRIGLASKEIGYCQTEQTQLVMADGSAPLPVEFHRIQSFLRLWRRTEWTILELDKIITALRHCHESGRQLYRLIPDLADIKRILRGHLKSLK